MPLRTPMPGSDVAVSIKGDRLVVGEYVPERDLWFAPTPTMATTELMLSFWTADKTEPINNVCVTTAGSAAVATPTVCRMGIYSVNDAGDLTALLASTTNDTTLFAAGSTAYTKALTSGTFNKIAGNRYATAILVVSTVGIPTFIGYSASSIAAGRWAHMFELPQKASKVATQSDLGPSYTYAVQASTPHRIGFKLTP